MTDPEFRCHWTHQHGPHPWTPMIADPENPQVLYIDPDSPVTCPGKDTP